MRRLIYRSFIGRDGWPLAFRPPAQEMPHRTSPDLYIHLPFCRQLCPHCPYNKAIYRPTRHQEYGNALTKEITGYLSGGKVLPIDSLYFGGGTPTVTPDLIEGSIALLRPFLKATADIGVEVHPADASDALLARLRAAGVNRVSLGIETFRDDLLPLLGRTYTSEQAAQAIVAAGKHDFACVDVNLICAIPGQTHRDTAHDARRCIDLGIDQLSAYTLFTFEHTPIGRKVAGRRFPVYGDVSRILALHAISRVCRAAGFRRTSPWNYTRPGIAPYSTVTRESYLGFGAGASSKIDGVFTFNTFSVDHYIRQERNRPAIVLDAGDRLRRFHWLYWQLYKTEVDQTRYGRIFGRDLNRDFRTVFSLLRLSGMIHRRGTRWHVTEFGAIWTHRLQQLFSITYIDDVWRQCLADPWPQEVILQ